MKNIIKVIKIKKEDVLEKQSPNCTIHKTYMDDFWLQLHLISNEFGWKIRNKKNI